MGVLYEKINEKEILCKDMTFPENFPAIYIDEMDRIYCYHSVVDKSRFLFGSSPYWLRNSSVFKMKDSIRGYFVIKNGAVCICDRFVNERVGYFDENAKVKQIPAYVCFPTVSDTSYSVECGTYPELNEILTREIFGLTYKELNELIHVYNKTFNVLTDIYYTRYPSITRSLKRDNYCSLNDLWIPEGFPYIAFAESQYVYSTISFYSFYSYIQFLLMRGENSYNAMLLKKNGLSEDTLNHLLEMRLYLNYDCNFVNKYMIFNNMD